MRNIDSVEQANLAKATTNPDIIFELLHSPDVNVRYNLARNPSLDYETFELLSKDSDSSVRYSLGFNPSLPRDIVDCLYNDNCWIVKYAALCHIISHFDLVTSEKAEKMEELRTLILANQ